MVPGRLLHRQGAGISVSYFAGALISYAMCQGCCLGKLFSQRGIAAEGKEIAVYDGIIIPIELIYSHWHSPLSGYLLVKPFYSHFVTKIL